MRLGPRNRELLYLFLVGATVSIGYATVFLAQSKVVSATSLTWGAFFLALLLIAHLGVRFWAPLADPYLLPATGVLCGLGVTMIFRLNPALSSKQTMWLVIGIAMMFALLYLVPDYRSLERYKYIIGAGSVLALVATVSPLGSEVRGAKLWIDFGPVQIQPGEFAKVGIVIFLAAYLRENRELLSMRFSPKHLGPLVLFWGASLALLVLMNDFGTSLLFYGTFLLMVYVATARLWYLFVGLATFVGGSMLVYQAASHVQQRFDVWLDPWKDPQGTGYQVIQGLFALADGGMFGRGLGQAFLVLDSGTTVIPDAHTDFIIAALGAEIGWLGVVGVLLVYLVITWRGLVIAAQCTDGFSKLLAFGLTTVFAMQSIIIVGGVVRLLPLTGQTLPFVSYGGSSILANFLVITLLLMLSHTQRAQQLRPASGGDE
jgi:cell division protein FtsW (lipid II flippase)